MELNKNNFFSKNKFKLFLGSINLIGLSTIGFLVYNQIELNNKFNTLEKKIEANSFVENNSLNKFIKDFDFQNLIATKSKDLYKSFSDKIDNAKDSKQLMEEISALNEAFVKEYSNDSNMHLKIAKDMKSYIIHPEKYPYLKNWINDQANKYYIPNFPERIGKEAIKSAIIYQYINYNSKDAIFSILPNIEDRIELSAKLLATIAELETGSPYMKHNATLWSPTQAWGRFQVNGTTASDFIINMILKNHINFDKIDIEDLNKHKYVYGKIVDITKEIEKNNKIRTGQKWSSSDREKQIKNLLTFGNRFVKTAERLSNQGKFYIDGKGKKIYVKDYYKTHNTTINNGKYWDMALKFMDFYKSPINQGIASLEVLELKLKYSNINQQKLNEKNLKKFIKDSLVSYNADKRIIKVNGKKIKKEQKYGNDGVDLFLKRFEGSLKNIEVSSKNIVTLK